MNSKWVKNYNVSSEAIKILEESTDSMLFDIILSNIFLGVFSGKGNKNKMNKQNYIKLKSFCTMKETVNKMKRQPTKWEKIAVFCLLVCLSFVFLPFSWAAPAAYGDSQARGRIRAVATGLCHSHSNARAEPHLQPTPQLTQCRILNPLSKARD